MDRIFIAAGVFLLLYCACLAQKQGKKQTF